MRIRQPLVVGGPSHLAGHVKQESDELVETLLNHKPEDAVLVPSRETATGFRALELQDRHKWSGFVIEKERAQNVIGPPPELLSAMKTFSSRRAFVPEVYSNVLERNLRFMVSLPPHFDAKKASEYPVVHVLPDVKTMSLHLGEGNLTDKLERALTDRGLENAIVVVGERFDDRTSIDRDVLNAKGKAALSSDVQLYVQSAFGANPRIDATLVLPSLSDYRAIVTDVAPQLRGEDRSTFVADQQRTDERPKKGLLGSMLSFFIDDDVPRSSARSSESRSDDYGSSRSYESRGGDYGSFERKKSDDDSSWFKKPSWDGAVVVSGGERPKVTQAGSWDGKVKRGSLPEGKFFEPLRDRASAGVAVAGLESKLAGDVVPYAAVVPQGFDRKRSYPVDVVTTSGAHFKDVVRKLGAGQVHVDDRIVLVVDSSALKDKTQLERVVKYELLAAVADSLPIDVSRVHDVRALGGDASTWVSKIESKPSSPAKSAGGPVVFSEGEWLSTAPTIDYDKSFPRVGWGARTSKIPTSMQKQPADHGTMFVPVIDSKAVDKPFRAGVYLPPGYDPNSAQKYPVLVMLPGKGGALEQWMSAGTITEKLDHMMAGDAQKMIVVIPDKTDSLWFDYDKNGEPSVGDKGKRNYEGLLVDEILPFVFDNLNADKANMAIAGISRGGFGAMSLAGRHPGWFKSVSAHSGVLALEHGDGELGKIASGEISKHLGPQGDPVWSQIVPKDLVDQGAFSTKDGPRVLVDIGADDPYFVEDNIAFEQSLTKAGVKHEMHIYGGDVEKKHNWDTWSALLPSWIAFHQESFGKAGDAGAFKSDVVDLTADVTEDRLAKLAARKAELEQTVRDLAKHVPTLSADDRERTLIGYSERQRTVYRPLAALQDTIDDVNRELRNLQGKPLHVLEARVPKLESKIDELGERIERGRRTLVGRVPPPVKADPAALGKLPSDVRADLNDVIAKLPDLEKPLAKLATVRPGVFTGDDEVTGKNFARQLRDFVSSKDFDAKKDMPGFAEFIDRMAERRYDWRRGGYSNAVCAVMNTIFNHPGIVLALTSASRRDQTLDFPTFYPGDPATRVRPMGDLLAAFSHVDFTETSFGDLPGADLGYERAILRIVRNTLCPPAETMPSTRAFGQRTNMPVAEGLAKLRGREVLYGYAMNIKTGEDLVKAVQSQGKEGLPMSDMKMGYGGRLESFHFPVFYDYDDKTRTIEMQHWGAGPVRMPIDGLELDDVGVYYEPTKGMEPFLTPEKQKNWESIKAAREGRDPDAPVRSRWRDDD